MLSDQQITKFQELYKARYGKEISREDAYEQGVKLLRLIQLTYKPMTQDEYEMVKKRRRETKENSS